MFWRYVYTSVWCLARLKKKKKNVFVSIFVSVFVVRLVFVLVLALGFALALGLVLVLLFELVIVLVRLFVLVFEVLLFNPQFSKLLARTLRFRTQKNCLDQISKQARIETGSFR